MDDLKVYGAPGCGKTHFGIDWVGDAVAAGEGHLEQVAFCSFTRAACEVARERIARRFGADADRLEYCRTLHALSKRALGIEGRDWLADSRLQEFAEGFGYQLGGKRASAAEDAEDLDELGSVAGADAPYLAVWNFARNRLITDVDGGFREFWRYDPQSAMRLDAARYRALVRDYEAWKLHEGLRDFTDLLLEVVATGATLPVDVVVVDEAQDLTPLLWRAADSLFSHARTRASIGDDDQAIYGFQGADPALLNTRPALKTLVLEHSHRLPREVHAAAGRIIGRNRLRVPKAFSPRDDWGHVSYPGSLHQIDFAECETWYVLVRNWALAPALAGELEELGIPYTVGGRRMGSPWVEPGPVVAVRAFLRLAEGKDITLDELHSLIARTPSATKARPDGFWRYGAKKPLEDARSTSPGATTNLRDLTARGLTEHGARAIVAADLRALEARIPLEYLTAYRRAMAAGRWGKRAADVRVSSVHGVKGGEADGVVMGMSCTAMPLRAMDHPHRREEETRIAYVAMTRAFKRFYGVPVPGASFEWNLCRS